MDHILGNGTDPKYTKNPRIQYGSKILQRIECGCWVPLGESDNYVHMMATCPFTFKHYILCYLIVMLPIDEIISD